MTYLVDDDRGVSVCPDCVPSWLTGRMVDEAYEDVAWMRADEPRVTAPDGRVWGVQSQDIDPNGMDWDEWARDMDEQCWECGRGADGVWHAACRLCGESWEVDHVPDEHDECPNCAS